MGWSVHATAGLSKAGLLGCCCSASGLSDMLGALLGALLRALLGRLLGCRCTASTAKILNSRHWAETYLCCVPSSTHILAAGLSKAVAQQLVSPEVHVSI